MAKSGFKSISGLNVSSRFVLAPMAGVNCRAFRTLCREYGAGLIYTQMYEDSLIIDMHKKSPESLKRFLNIGADEHPIALQLVGSNPCLLSKAAEIAGKHADFIDINFGCCLDEVLNKKAGGYLVSNLNMLSKVATAVIKSAKKPVLAKIRIGFDSQSINGVKTAMLLERLGVSAIAVHGRTVEQKFKGKANWTIIRQIKEKLNIPVIGNGDIRNAKLAKDMLSKTGCDFAMIGRRAMGDPAFFARCINYFFETQKIADDLQASFKKFTKYFFSLSINPSLSEYKAHVLWFAKRAKIRQSKRLLIHNAKSLEEIKLILKETLLE